MKYRMGTALLSLTGFFLATYLYLYKIGLIPGLACGSGACEVVQSSEWSRLLGQPVAVYGVAGYLATLVLALIALQQPADRRHWSGSLLLGGSLAGLAFTAWLTFAEAFLIHAWCRWCLGSAAIMALLFLCAVLGWRTLRPAR